MSAKGEKSDGKKDDEKLIVKNRRATFDFTVEERFEGGLVLVGSEVKSMRAGKVDLVDAFASVDRGEMWLKQLYVAPFEQAKAFPHEPRRARKVLLHGPEILQIDKAIARGGYTLIPLRLYFKKGRVKVELGLAKGKKTHDKRHEIAAKTAERETRAAIGRGRKGGPMSGPSGARVTWTGEGEAVVLELGPSTITLRSTAPSPPGSRIEGALEGGGVLRVKVHGSRRQDDGSFVLEGRPLDLTRELRERITERMRSGG